MTPEEARRQFYQGEAEEFGYSANEARLACISFALHRSQIAAHEYQSYVYRCARLAGHFGRLALGQTDVVAGLSNIQQAEDDPSRCAVCGWKLATRAYFD